MLYSEKGFYVGDLEHVVNLTELWNKYQREDGMFAESKFAICSLPHGEGAYEDFDHHKYHISSGTIGVIAYEGIERPAGITFGRYVRIPGHAHFEVQEGVVTVVFADGSEVVINTLNEPVSDILEVNTPAGIIRVSKKHDAMYPGIYVDLLTPTAEIPLAVAEYDPLGGVTFCLSK